VHRAHLAVAEAARDALKLDRVILVPAGQPMSKLDRHITGAAHRLKMLRLAVRGRPGLSISSIEIERPGPSYTVDTVAALQKKYGAAAELYFILGCDSLAQLPLWHEPADLAAMCRIVAVPRPGYDRPDLSALERKIPGITQSVIFLDRPNLDISATTIRERISQGGTIDDLVPGPVARYIEQNRLYSETGGKP
jgi:nicotinate-nucleotide adenylyltransferase